MVAMDERKVFVHHFWARKGTRGVQEGGLLRDCDMPSSVRLYLKMNNDERLTLPFSSKGKLGKGA